jgi:hypothetical protein
VHPQEVRHVVKMSSVTGPHVDGVVAQVALPRPFLEPVDATIARPIPTARAFLAFESEPFSVTIPASKLDDLGFVEMIDRTGNGVMLMAMRRTPCVAGFMAGRWARTSSTGGVFGGVWQQAGKVVNLQGEFLAHMTGSYSDGVYEGELHGRGGALSGHVRGRYTGEDGHGVFQGGWRQKCATEPPYPCLMTADDVRICGPMVRPEESAP